MSGQIEQLNQEDIVADNTEKQTVIDLFAVELDATKNDVVPEDIQAIVNDIMEDPQQPPEQEDQEKIGNLLKEWEIAKAVSQAIDLVLSIFSWSKKKAGLDDFKKYSIDFTTLSDSDLDDRIDRLQNKIKQSWLSVHQKLRFTYAFSRAKDEKLSRENPQSTPFEKLARNIQVGDVILMNKDKKSSWWIIDWIKSKAANEWLQETSNSIRTHSVIVTKVSGDNIEITHATVPVVKSEDLESYLKNYEAVDLCTLQQPPESRQKAIDYAYSLLWKPYDATSATKQALIGDNEKDDKYNCGELVADSLVAANPIKFQNLENKTFPSDFLFNNYLQPSYMTTIVS